MEEVVMSTEDAPAPQPRTTGEPFECILLGIDESPNGDRALEVAAGLAADRWIAVHLAIVRSPGLSAAIDEAAATDRAEPMRQAGLDVTVHLLESNDPAEALAALAGSLPRPLVCLATHGRTAVAARVFGSVSLDLEQLWAGPLLLIGPDAALDRHTPTTLVACVSGDDDVDPLIALAQSWVSTFGGSMEFFEAVDPSSVPPGAKPDAPATDELQRAADLSDAAVTWVADRDPARAILDRAAPGGVVLALHSHGRTGLKRVRYGSVAGSVLHRGAAPVLVLPRREDT
jgi:nucleotide-binding universal stress UspA family protein